MTRLLMWIAASGLLFTTSFTWGTPIANAGLAGRHSVRMYSASSSQPLTVRLSSQDVPVGESIWLTISGGVEPYVLVSAENKIQVVSRGKNTYQITGLVAGNSGLTVGDSKNNIVTTVITVLPRR